MEPAYAAARWLSPRAASLPGVDPPSQTARDQGASPTSIAIAKLDGQSDPCWEPRDDGDNPRLSHYDDGQFTERVRLVR